MYWPTCRALSGLSVANLLDKSFWGGRVDICPMVFHDVVEQCICIFDNRVCAPSSRTLPVVKKWNC